MITTENVHLRLATLTASTHGAFTTASAARAGISRSSIRNMVRAGRVQRVMPHTFVLVPKPMLPSEDARLSAAVLSAGSDAALSHSSAAARHEIWSRHRGSVHVTSPRHHGGGTTEWVRFHQSRELPDHHVEVVRGISTTSVARTCCDLGSQLTSFQLANVLREAAYRELLDLRAVGVLLDERFRAPGTAVVRRAIELHLAGSAGTRSWTEDRLLQAIVRAALPTPCVNQPSATSVSGLETDFAWPSERLVVEVDGRRHHALPGALVLDPGRDHLLRMAGWRVLRFTADEVWRELPRVLAAIAAALAA